MLKHTFYAIALIVFSVSCSSKIPSDLIIHHARIYTVDSAFSVAEAIAIKDGKVQATGKNDDILATYEAKEVTDAGGKAIFPGFMDAHAHFLNYGMTLQQVDLVGTKSWEECMERVKAFVTKKKIAPGLWIQGRGWDQNDWPVQKFPTKELLDKYFPDNPVTLERIDGHAQIVNQRALDLAHITAGQTLEGGPWKPSMASSRAS